MSVKWTGINTITGRMNAAQRAVQAGTVAIASTQAAKGAAAMVSSAPWNDQSGAARSGLYGDSEATGTGAQIEFGHTVEYGPYLEAGTSRMTARPIVQPTADVVAREASEELIRLAGRWGA